MFPIKNKCVEMLYLNYYFIILLFNILPFLASVNKTSLKMRSFAITAETAKIYWGTFKYVPLKTGGLAVKKAESKTSFFMQKVVKWLTITSYSCENFKLSFAFRRSM